MLIERPHSSYTRAKTWAALYSQHINACYALVPYSATNNSIAVIRCTSPAETAAAARDLLARAEECEAFYAARQASESAPALLARARHAVVLARSSDYHHYHLGDHPEFRLVICGLHNSYVPLPVWETRTNHRYGPHETVASITAPGFERMRATPLGHTILLGALICGDQEALAFLKRLPPRTQRRIRQEAQSLQETRYRGRPLAFLNEAERRDVGHKIAAGLRRFHAQKRA